MENKEAKAKKTLKSNADAVRDYHKNIQDIKVRVPKENESGIVYIEEIKARAEELGIVTTKGADKGRGNINGYILTLIANDMNMKIGNVAPREIDPRK